MKMAFEPWQSNTRDNPRLLGQSWRAAVATNNFIVVSNARKEHLNESYIGKEYAAAQYLGDVVAENMDLWHVTFSNFGWAMILKNNSVQAPYVPSLPGDVFSVNINPLGKPQYSA